MKGELCTQLCLDSREGGLSDYGVVVQATNMVIPEATFLKFIKRKKKGGLISISSEGIFYYFRPSQKKTTVEIIERKRILQKKKNSPAEAR